MRNFAGKAIKMSTAAVGRSRMRRWFPGTAHPLVVSAPMDFVTNAKLASEVSRVQGLGFIQGGRTFKPESPALPKLEKELSTAASLLQTSAETKTLPIGVGFVLYSSCAETHFGQTTVPLLARFKPAAVWFFAPDPKMPDTLARVVRDVRDARETWDPRIVVQVGNVGAAREAARLGVDIIVAQGSDAGGHQFAKGAGIVSLVPEIRDMLDREFEGKEIAVWAAGGIVDGRGVAAALALGAEAAVLGTRYMIATESDAQDFKRKAILSTVDGGVNTVKSQLHDHVQSNREWPDLYDGRAVVHPSHHDHEAGIPIHENEAKFKAAKESGDTSRMVTWSGTGVGLVNSELPAAEITTTVRDEAIGSIRNLQDYS
ncbi:FMN-dependent 2-nitropropane dioxygenase [Xylariaceae sp. FL1272]|nr:FMN-dependent 2-nitropropane dioxygenase [Xylariaceae sp. FL1272]